MKEACYYILAELKALGLRCVAYGPEFWLGVAAIAGVAVIGIIVSIFVFREEDKHDRR